MIGFLASLPWFGWALIALFLVTLWQLPALLRKVLNGNAGQAERPLQPGEDPPHLRPGAQFQSGGARHNDPTGSEP